MSARLIVIASSPSSTACASRIAWPRWVQPRVAVLIPAYNEETVIVRTIRSSAQLRLHNLHIIVIDDGSLDRTGK